MWVDETACVIHNVLVLGPESPNIPQQDNRPVAGVTKGTRYTPTAFQSACRVFEGITVRKNHPDRRNPFAERDAEDDLGVLRNCNVRPAGVRANFHYNPAHPFNAQLVEDVKRRIGSRRGFSPNASGEFKVENGVCVVENILCARSVDIVSNPATTGSLLESGSTSTMPSTLGLVFRSLLPKLKGVQLTTLAAFVESDAMCAATKRKDETGAVMEDDPLPPMADAPMDEPAPEAADADEALSNGFKAALTKLVEQFIDGDLDEAEFLSKIKEFAKTHSKLNGGGEADSKPAETPAPAAATESVDAAAAMKAELDALRGREAATKLCKSLNYEPSQRQLAAIAQLSESDRREFVLELVGMVRKPQSKGPGSAQVRESTTDTAAAQPKFPANREETKKLITA